MQVDSKPEELDDARSPHHPAEDRAEALKKETDAASKDRLTTLQSELANLEQQSAGLTQKWQAEKDKIHAEAKIKEELDAARSNSIRPSARATSRKRASLATARSPARKEA
jgi:ATP-dependent Clp protease ATP-binding subunit ClpB